MSGDQWFFIVVLVLLLLAMSGGGAGGPRMHTAGRGKQPPRKTKKEESVD